MADWATIAEVGTAGGTLVLAVATFASVRSANRTARIAEQALQEQRRPLLVQSRLDDPEQKIMFVDQHWARVGGSRAAVEHVDGVVYLVLSLRNVGAGIGVCQGWDVRAGLQALGHRPPSPRTSSGPRRATCTSRPATWGCGRGRCGTPTIPVTARSRGRSRTAEPLALELLYTDQVGGQRTITRFTLTPSDDHDETVAGWATSAATGTSTV